MFLFSITTTINAFQVEQNEILQAISQYINTGQHINKTMSSFNHNDDNQDQCIKDLEILFKELLRGKFWAISGKKIKYRVIA